MKHIYFKSFIIINTYTFPQKLGIDFNERKTLLAQTYITDPNDPTIIKESKTNLEKISILGNRPILLEEANEVEISEKVDDEVTFKVCIWLFSFFASSYYTFITIRRMHMNRSRT